MTEDGKKRLINTLATIGGIATIFFVGAAAICLRGKWTSNSVWLVTGWLALCAWIGGTIIYSNGLEKDDDKIRATVVMDASIAFAVGVLGVTFWQHDTAGSWSIAVLWSLACLILGGVSGFLFGIPRSRTHAAKADQSPIEQIADWLTKIIVGLGLTNLSNIPGLLSRWANYVAVGVGKEHASDSAALSMILYFVLLGFLGGYLLTNLFLENLINRFSGAGGVAAPSGASGVAAPSGAGDVAGK